MTKSRNLIAPKKAWTDAELAYLREHYPDEPAKDVALALGCKLHVVYTKVGELGLRKSEAFKASPAAGYLDSERGAQYRFKPGQKPWSAGKKGLHQSPGTEFKRGNVAANVQEVGALRINTAGDIDIKLAPGPNQWLSLRRYAWEQVHGPIAPGLCVLPRNDDGHDTRIENLYLVSRAESIRLHLLGKYPKELRNAMALRGMLNKRIEQAKETSDV